jgi:hypothetical protein
MHYPQTWLNASDGAAATGMDVEIVTPWERCGNKDAPSYDNSWPAGVVGTFSLEFCNPPNPTYATPGRAVPTSDYGTAPTQPTGAADGHIISAESRGEWSRCRYVPTSGGSGKLPTTTLSMTPDNEQ